MHIKKAAGHGFYSEGRREMIITSRQNPLIKEIVSLKDRKGRREHGLFIVEGIKQVHEACTAGAEISQIIQAESFSGLAEIEGLPVTVVSDGVFGKLSDEVSPQGILALLRIPDCTPLPPRENCLLLDGVSDPGNLGTIIRTANAAGYGEIYLRNCADPFSPKCVRAAMSGIFFVRPYIGDAEILRVLQGLPLICADMSGEDVFHFIPPEKYCLVIGNEANGVSGELRRLCEYTVKIPMRPTCESLNAGVSAGILMYELANCRAKIHAEK